MEQKIKNIIISLLFIAIGVFFFFHSRSYGIYSAANFGPGYYPMGLSAILVIVGLLGIFNSCYQILFKTSK